MAITEFVVPSFKQEAESIAAYPAAILPSLNSKLDKAEEDNAGPLSRTFGKLILENGKDVSNDFRPVLGLEWRKPEHFLDLVKSESFAGFIDVVKPHATAAPNPQIYETDVSPADAFGCALTEVWQVKIGDAVSGEKEEEVRGAWEKFLGVVRGGEVKSLQGVSLNQEERLWVGVLGWESFDDRQKILSGAAVIQAKEGLARLTWNTFVAAFPQ